MRMAASMEQNGWRVRQTAEPRRGSTMRSLLVLLREATFGPVMLRAILVLVVFGSVVRADAPKAPTVNGRLTSVEGVPVLIVWGTPRERGFAQGNLFAGRFIDMLDTYLGDTEISGGPATYEASTQLVPLMMKIPPAFQDELRGLLAGIEARLDGKTTVPRLKRKIAIRDLVTVNCIPDSAAFGCSSFAIWGRRTTDGDTIAGRNLDWNVSSALLNSQVVVVHVPEAGSGAVAWVSVGWPGLIGCLTGMNAKGVTVSMHDVWGGKPSGKMGFTPRALALREAIEAARSRTAQADILVVFRKRTVAVGNNVAVALPHHSRNPAGVSAPSVVFEYDGVTTLSGGVTVRSPKPPGKVRRRGGAMQVTTNHYLSRAEPTRCRRYETISRTLAAAEKNKEQIDIAAAWRILSSVAQTGRRDGGLATYHSVVFEPDKMKMHVALTDGGKPAPDCKHFTLDVAALIKSASD